jgi:DNA-binding MarR family transcriptional regulator
MNDNDGKTLDSYRSFLMLDEIGKEEAVSQRELAVRLGIALGLVNSYLKNLVAKGYVRVKNFPGNRYSYLLTPSGAAEKSRLAYQHLRYFTNLYLIARQDFASLFSDLRAAGVGEVAFCGVDEVAEIAYLSLKGSGVELAEVLDDDRAGESFFGKLVLPLAEAGLVPHRHVVLTSFKRQDALARRLRELGVGAAGVHTVGGASVNEA